MGIMLLYCIVEMLFDRVDGAHMRKVIARSEQQRGKQSLFYLRV